MEKLCWRQNIADWIVAEGSTVKKSSKEVVCTEFKVSLTGSGQHSATLAEIWDAVSRPKGLSIHGE